MLIEMVTVLTVIFQGELHSVAHMPPLSAEEH